MYYLTCLKVALINDNITESPLLILIVLFINKVRSATLVISDNFLDDSVMLCKDTFHNHHPQLSIFQWLIFYFLFNFFTEPAPITETFNFAL